MDKDVIAAEAQMQAEINDLRRSSKPRPMGKMRGADPYGMTGCDCPMCQAMAPVSASVCKTGRGFESRPGLQFDHTIAVILVALFYLAIGFPL